MMYLCEPKRQNREARKPLCLFMTGLSPKVVPLKLLLKKPRLPTYLLKISFPHPCQELASWTYLRHVVASTFE